MLVLLRCFTRRSCRSAQLGSLGLGFKCQIGRSVASLLLQERWSLVLSSRTSKAGA